jgi:hypothetical protein
MIIDGEEEYVKCSSLKIYHSWKKRFLLKIIIGWYVYFIVFDMDYKIFYSYCLRTN